MANRGAGDSNVRRKRQRGDDSDEEGPLDFEIPDANKKHTLDSDEEDDTGKYEVMHENDIEGQEDGTVGYDGEIQITPFNMNEELEEGEFDKDGNYFLKKESDIKDHWLDNIDWVKIKSKEETANMEDDDDDFSLTADKIDEVDVIKKMLEFMQPKETVAKALQRLGGKGVSASSRWIKKKKGESSSSDNTDATNKENMLKLTELADTLVRAGFMEIYHETYEKLNHKLNMRTDMSGSRNKLLKDDDTVLDMFAEEVDEKVGDSEPKVAGSSEENGDSKEASAKPEEAKKADPLSDEVNWEFKWEDKDEAEIHGPHSSSEMLRWVQEGYFADGVWVRKTSQPDEKFYSSSRIDFDLYT